MFFCDKRVPKLPVFYDYLSPFFSVPELLARPPVLTGVKSGMLLHMAELFEATVAV
jgi:hypothetical protein